MSSQRQETVATPCPGPGLAGRRRTAPDRRLRRIHYDWLEAGEHTQRTVAQLSQQLRRFLDDQAWLENRRIMDLLRGVESKALTLRSQPTGPFMEIADTAASLELPLERPLHTPTVKTRITDLSADAPLLDDETDASALFNQIVVDKPRPARNVRYRLQSQGRPRYAKLPPTIRSSTAGRTGRLPSNLPMGNSRQVIDEAVEGN